LQLGRDQQRLQRWPSACGQVLLCRRRVDQAAPIVALKLGELLVGGPLVDRRCTSNRRPS
jgi:hypothetical protein